MSTDWEARHDAMRDELWANASVSLEFAAHELEQDAPDLAKVRGLVHEARHSIARCVPALAVGELAEVDETAHD